MKKHPSKKYAIYILLLSIYILLSLLDIDKNLDELPFGGFLGFFIIIIFGLIPFCGLVNAYFFTYRFKTKKDKIKIVRESFESFKKYIVKKGSM